MNNKAKLAVLAPEDQKIFLEAIEEQKAGRGFSHAYTMSIFSQRGELKQAGDYTYRDLSGETIFYLNRVISKAGPIALDVDGKVIPESNVMLGYHHLLIKHLGNFSRLIQSPDVSSAVSAFPGSALAIQSWFITYGHYQDEVFALADFLREVELDASVVLDYPPSDNIHKQYLKTSTNYERLQTLAFGTKAYNLFEAGKVPVKLNGCLFISHLMNAPTFHRFPERIRNLLVRRTEGYQPHNPEVIFISREVAKHLPRNIKNQDELEHFCRISGMQVCYPEQLSFDRLVRRLNAVKALIITWGGALTNLIYVTKGAKVLILKSQSYRHESLDLFKHIIAQRSLSVSVLDTDSEDTVSISMFKEALQEMQA